MTSKQKKELEELENNEKKYIDILNALNENIDNSKKYISEKEFDEKLREVLKNIELTQSFYKKILQSLSKTDKEAPIQYDKNNEIIYDKSTKSIEIVKYNKDIDEYMAEEILPFVENAKAFFEENLNAKKPIIKTGAEIPFTRYFYQYKNPRESDELEKEFISLEKSISDRINSLFKEL